MKYQPHWTRKESADRFWPEWKEEWPADWEYEDLQDALRLVVERIKETEELNPTPAVLYLQRVAQVIVRRMVEVLKPVIAEAESNLILPENLGKVTL